MPTGYNQRATLAVLAVLALPGCTRGDSASDLDDDRALLQSLPTMPGARVTSRTSGVHYNQHDPELLRRETGHFVTATIRPRQGAAALDVVTFYERRLAGWRCARTESDPQANVYVLECSRSKESVAVNTDNLGSPRGTYDLTADSERPAP